MPQDSTLDNLRHQDGYRTAAVGEIRERIRVGRRGGQDVMLIPGWGFGAEVFREFMNDHRDEFHMVSVSLPGFGGSPAPPMPPQGTSYGDQTWISAAVAGVVRAIVEEGLRRPVLVGHFLIGTQVALRVAAERPDLVSGVVIIGGEPWRYLPSRRDSTGQTPVTAPERRVVVDRYMAPGWFKTVTTETWHAQNYAAELYSKDSVRAQRYWTESARVPLPVMIRYLCEYIATDLRESYVRVTVPTRILLPSFPAAVLADTTKSYVKPFFLDAWRGVDAFNSRMRLVQTADARLFTTADNPALVVDAILEVRREFSNTAATSAKWHVRGSRASDRASADSVAWRRDVRTPDGVVLATAIIGKARADTIIVPLGSLTAPMLKSLGQSHTLIVYDLRGRGRSDSMMDTARVNLEYDVQDLEAVRRHFRLARVHLIGWSYGGAVAAQFALQHPERVGRLVLLNPIAPRAAPYPPSGLPRGQSPGVGDTTAAQLLREWGPDGARAPTPEAFCRMANRVEAAELIPEPVARARRRDVCDLPNEWPSNLGRVTMARLSGLGSYDWTAAFAALATPTLVVAGNQDFIPTDASRAWVNRSSARLVVVPNAGHYAVLEQPEVVLRAISAFLRGSSAPRSR